MWRTNLIDISRARSIIQAMEHEAFHEDPATATMEVERILRQTFGIHSREPFRHTAEDMPTLRYQLKQRGLHVHDLSFAEDDGDGMDEGYDAQAFGNDDAEGIAARSRLRELERKTRGLFPDVEEEYDYEDDAYASDLKVSYHLPIFLYRDGMEIKTATYTQLLKIIGEWTVGNYRRPHQIDESVKKICEELEQGKGSGRTLGTIDEEHLSDSVMTMKVSTPTHIESSDEIFRAQLGNRFSE